jgi:anti-anti-sigma regulatory factor
MLEVAADWKFQVDQSPEWLFVRVLHVGIDSVKPQISETLWSLAGEQGINRLVIELGEAAWLTSYLIGQLMVLHKRAHLDGGTVRLCGISERNYQVLEMMQLTERFPNYPTREAAVMGHAPRKPR